MKITSRLMVVLLAVSMLFGCTTVHQEFAGLPSDQVWTALLAVAESPNYDDWIVTDNDVWVDEATQRIEIYRRLRRVIQQPAYKARRENREWRFQVIFELTDPPLATFTSRGLGVPSHAQHEGERYFLDVLDLLSGMPPPDEAPSTASSDTSDTPDK
ncbi:MAG: hypothetical protein IIA64_10070 [Planctomycetes bacterium]|nr:hypothetical protein [Planctomycetota bacterium]